MRVLAALAALSTLVGAAAASGATAHRTQLRISFQASEGADPIMRTLVCDPAGGTLPRPGAACRRLALLRAPFAPVPPELACTEIWGGPQRAVVTGVFRGRRVWARFSRVNGCEIRRWDRVSFLFAPGGD